MNDAVKNILKDILANGEDMYYSGQLEKYYRKVIDMGSFGEMGQNYYLYIYTNSFRGKVTHDAVIFIYTPFDREKPFTVIMTNPTTVQRHNDTFIDIAIYFMKKELPNTLNLSNDIREVYDKAKKIIKGYADNEEIKRKEFDSFNFDVRKQEIKVKKLQLKKPEPRFVNPYVMGKVQELKIQVGSQKGGEPGEKNVKSKRGRGHLGLCLDLTAAGSMGKCFLPVILPVKKDGAYGPAKIITPSQVNKFELGESPGLLTEYMENLYRYHRKWGVDKSIQDAVANLYFEKMVRLFMEMPDQLTFYQQNDIVNKLNKNILPLKKITIKKIDVKFAPSVNGDNLEIFIEVTAPDGRVFQPGLTFQVVSNGDNHVYLFFKIPGVNGAEALPMDAHDDAYFASPEEPGEFDPFFRFLASIKTISVNDFKETCNALLEIASGTLVVHPEPLPLYHLEFRPLPVLKILDATGYMNMPKRIEIYFDYTYGFRDFLAKNPSDIQAHIQGNTHFEEMCFLLLTTDPLLRIGKRIDHHWFTGGGKEIPFFAFQDNDEFRWLVEKGGSYLEKGFKIYSGMRRQYIANTNSSLNIQIQAGVKWLEFKPTLQDGVTGEATDIGSVDFLNREVNDINGKLHLLKKEDIEKLSRIYKYSEQHGDTFRIPSDNYFLINELYDKRMEEIPLLREKLRSARKLESFKKIPSSRLSHNFNGKLRKYQETGFQWLYFLREYNLSGCLADDMGLGKTIQTLALLQTLKDSRKLSISLLVVPVSAIPNWEAEIEKFTPEMEVYRHMGNARRKDFDDWVEYDLVITSYATLRNDIEIFKEFTFDYIILDESQNIKNFASQTSMAIKVLKSSHRLALSGTPIENNSMELWSLFDFLMPGFLGTHTWFKKQWALPVEKDHDLEKRELLKKMIYPLILRRKKEQVETELPAKTEIVQALQMESKQMKVYAQTAAYYRNAIENEIKEKGLEKSAFKILEGMLRLRQICLFPHLADEKHINIPAIKFDHFTNLMEDILSEGHKVLVFSQFVKVLSILRDHFDRQAVKYSYIDGSVTLKEREKNVKDFQEKEDIQVFLLSLKAGGVALNLTAADYVIIFDPWWNPAVELQAIDRSHRIGQTRKVIVYRMVVKDTIEEKMLTLQDQKKELVDQLITSETKGFKNLTREDIVDLFKF